MENSDDFAESVKNEQHQTPFYFHLKRTYVEEFSLVPGKDNFATKSHTNQNSPNYPDGGDESEVEPECSMSSDNASKSDNTVIRSSLRPSLSSAIPTPKKIHLLFNQQQFDWQMPAFKNRPQFAQKASKPKLALMPPPETTKKVEISLQTQNISVENVSKCTENDYTVCNDVVNKPKQLYDENVVSSVENSFKTIPETSSKTCFDESAVVLEDATNVLKANPENVAVNMKNEDQIILPSDVQVCPDVQIKLNNTKCDQSVPDAVLYPNIVLDSDREFYAAKNCNKRRNDETESQQHKPLRVGLSKKQKVVSLHLK